MNGTSETLPNSGKHTTVDVGAAAAKPNTMQFMKIYELSFYCM